MAITISVDAAIVSAETASLVSSSITPVSGDSQLFIVVSIDDTSEGDFSSISESESATITQLASFANGNRRCMLFAINSPSLVARTVTVAMTATTDCSIDVFTVQNSNTDADPSDVTATNNGNSASPLTAITPTDTTDGMIIWLTCASVDGIYTSLGSGTRFIHARWTGEEFCTLYN